jgi:hypothetical protein
MIALHNDVLRLLFVVGKHITSSWLVTRIPAASQLSGLTNYTRSIMNTPELAWIFSFKETMHARD